MRPRQIPGTGLFVRGTTFDAEQIAGFNRDFKRINDYITYLNNNPQALAAFRERYKDHNRAPNAPIRRSNSKR